MRLRWILLVFILTVLVSVTVLIWVGLKPKSVALINLSIFKDSAAVSEAVLKRLDPQLRPETKITLFFDKGNLFHREVSQALFAARPRVSFAALKDPPQYEEGRLNIFLTEFPRSRSQEASFQWCPEEDFRHWECLSITKARSLYRKRLPPGRWVGFLDQVGRHDFVLALTLEK